jgi:hypothetical protein
LNKGFFPFEISTIWLLIWHPPYITTLGCRVVTVAEIAPVLLTQMFPLRIAILGISTLLLSIGNHAAGPETAAGSVACVV